MEWLKRIADRAVGLDRASLVELLVDDLRPFLGESLEAAGPDAIGTSSHKKAVMLTYLIGAADAMAKVYGISEDATEEAIIRILTADLHLSVQDSQTLFGSIRKMAHEVGWRPSVLHGGAAMLQWQRDQEPPTRLAELLGVKPGKKKAVRKRSKKSR